MGSRGRSIRLRIYFLVAIPLITMLGLFGYVAYTSINNWLNLDRAPNLIRATAEPLTNFVTFLQAERRAGVVYLSHPSAANLAAYQSAVTATKKGIPALDATINSPVTQQNSSPDENAALGKLVADVNGMSTLRAAVTAGKLPPLDALAAYTKIITDQDTVFQAQVSSLTNATAATEGVGLVSTINARESLDEQDAVLAGAFASGSISGQDRVAFGEAAGRQQDQTLTFQALLSPSELATFNTVFNRMAPTTLQSNLTTIQQAVAAGTPLRELEAGGLSPAAWQQLTRAYANANYRAATDAAEVTVGVDEGISNNAKSRVLETAGFGAAGLILTLIVTILLGRSINRRLTVLRRSAMTLAQQQLPAVVTRLRSGDSVDVAAEAPPLRVGSDEIGQVGQAIDTVRQTAIRAAVEESRLRQGVNDMFRNLARRSQSLLQRQLSVLDGMERKATDPDVLEDLFKMDHLTTRMRRHAEGLIILSGAPPGRGWSAPVKLIDVMRGAISEVEDYARVTVSTQARASLAGSAVTDVIHLLAELIENATTLSPPFTQVRVTGETVANGFAIEIEDRGLGMTPQRMAELNERLSSPQEINPTNTEQLGLFVVGQLARRHGIIVTLRQSPFGGTTAVAMIPQRLIVEEGPAAITSGQPEAAAAPNGSYAATGSYPANGGPYAANGSYGPQGAFGNGSGSYPANAYSPDGSYGRDGSYASYGSYEAYGPYGANRTPGGAGAPGTGPGNNTFYQPYGGNGHDQPQPSFSPSRSGFSPPRPPGRPPEWDNGPASQGGYGGNGGERGWTGRAGSQDPYAQGAPADWPEAGGSQGFGASQDASQGPGGGSIRISGALRQGGGAGPGVASETDGAAGLSDPSLGARRGRHGAAEVPVVTGVPVDRPGTPGTPDDQSFDVFTPLHRDDQSPGEQGGGGQPSYGQPSYGQPSYGQPSYGQPSYGQPSYGQPPYGQPSYGDGNNGDAGDHQQGGVAGGGSEEYKGLPRRVRQANLAPQLRSSVASGSTEASAVPPASAASLSDMRNTLSAMQRGWQQGRTQGQGDTEGNSSDGD